MTKPLRIGMIGYGFMGRTHTNGYKRVGDFFPELEYRPVLQAACARSQEKIQQFADQWGYQSIETDWKKLIARDDIDAVDICVPNNLHKEMAIAAAKAGRRWCFARSHWPSTLKKAKKMCQAIERAGVANTVWYNYRRVPAVTLAKKIIESGKLGKIFHYRANFLQDWTISEDLPQGGNALWRLDAAAAGSGVTGDLLATVSTPPSGSTGRSTTSRR
ncbi:MAG: Gfo/Idh/MocA family oxidoreductase [Planctomycetaceae bacterium]